MGIGEKITPILVGVAALVAAGHIVIGVYSVADISWMHFKVTGNSTNLREYKTRTRGLTLECVDNEEDSCQALERHDAKSRHSDRVRSVLDLRSASFGLPLASASFTGLIFLLGAIIYIVFRRKPRYRQVLLLIMGICNWISGLVSFVGLITYLESQNQEAHKYDPTLITARATWTETARTATTEYFGYAFILSVVSCILCHVATFVLFTASLWA
ncbi:hypothetical protein D915_002423 [Fasciola hepatica]|uniref:Uncharacterized protein n=1 Tax=Fasciola hepatica TaxID=6192 RepID=A0A4E0S1S6_FASHE|nr:hypothetical protein D915_002423 [Fasciola hepatica]